MEGTDGDDFPGFQIMVLEEDKAKARAGLRRLQKHAPIPLQVKPAAATMEMECNIAAALKSCGYNNADPPSSSSFSSSTCSYQNKDPIPLLSPLVLPSRFS